MYKPGPQRANLLLCVFEVEEYMTDIIFKMRGDLREILRESVVDYPSKAREKWIFDWPSQIILVVNQIYWCQEVEEAFMKLNKGQSNAMKVSSTSLFFNALLRPNVTCAHHQLAAGSWHNNKGYIPFLVGHANHIICLTV